MSPNVLGLSLSRLAYRAAGLCPSPGLPSGGDEEVRTPDPLRARQVLSQLSYTPIYDGPSGTRTPDQPVMSRLL